MDNISNLQRTFFSALKRILPASLKRTVRTAAYEGQRFRYKADMILFPQKTIRFCPCCQLRFRSFVSGHFLGHPERYNPERYKKTGQQVICPFCYSLPRHRILACWCEDHKQYLRSSDILYFAPEDSMSLWMKRNGVPCKTADMFQKADLKLDIQKTGLPEESYDVVFCNHVLEHVDDFRAALKEVFRILKPNGLFICSFPMDPKVELLDEDSEITADEERYLHYGQVDHKRVFGMKADQLLMDAGFEVEAIKGEDYPDEILPVTGPADYDMNRLFCCRKSGISDR